MNIIDVHAKGIFNGISVSGMATILEKLDELNIKYHYLADMGRYGLHILLDNSTDTNLVMDKLAEITDMKINSYLREAPGNVEE